MPRCFVKTILSIKADADLALFAYLHTHLPREFSYRMNTFNVKNVLTIRQKHSVKLYSVLTCTKQTNGQVYCITVLHIKRKGTKIINKVVQVAHHMTLHQAENNNSILH